LLVFFKGGSSGLDERLSAGVAQDHSAAAPRRQSGNEKAAARAAFSRLPAQA
jgi:hypothetical protein